MKLIGSVLIAGTAAQSCVQCTWTQDITTGEEYTETDIDIDIDIGNLTKDPRCFETKNDDQFVKECERGTGVGQKTYCFNEATMEWRPSGEQIIKITRGCRAAEWDDRCEAQHSWGYHRNDCHVTKETKGEPTNKGNLDELWALTNADQNGVKKCKSCLGQGTLSGNGVESGDQNFNKCKSGSSNDITCPVYARKGCYSFETIFEDLRPGQQDQVTYRRGCSHFEHDKSNRKCNNYHFGISNVEECKDTCDSKDNCNDQEIVVPANCYTCSYTWDDQGTVGVGDAQCRDGSLDMMITPCGYDQPYCVTERVGEWTLRGKQEHTIKRYCSANKYEPKKSGDTGLCSDSVLETKTGSTINSKMCLASCEKDNCNGDLSIERMFSHPNKVNSCKTCYYDQETGQGDSSCRNGSGTSSQQCPEYANAGCFTSTSWHQTGSRMKAEEDYRGCSFVDTSFDTCGDVQLGDSLYSVCKDLCTGKDCNNNQLEWKPASDSSSAFAITASVLSTAFFLL